MLCGGSDAAIIPIGTFFFSSSTLIRQSSTCHIKKLVFLIDVGAGLGGFVACRALSQRNDDPTKASRPWDIVI